MLINKGLKSWYTLIYQNERSYGIWWNNVQAHGLEKCICYEQFSVHCCMLGTSKETVAWILHYVTSSLQMRLLTAKSWNKYWRWSSKLLLEINLQDCLLQFSCIYEIQELNKVLLKKLLNSLQRPTSTSFEVTISFNSLHFFQNY